MNTHFGALPLLVALAQVSPAAASEMCIQVSYSMSLPYADLAFAGTLLKNEADVRLTFQAGFGRVHRPVARS